MKVIKLSERRTKTQSEKVREGMLKELKYITDLVEQGKITDFVVGIRYKGEEGPLFSSYWTFDNSTAFSCLGLCNYMADTILDSIRKA